MCSRPVSSTLPIQVPLVESGERSGLEQRLLTGRLLLSSSTTTGLEDKVSEVRQQEVECLMKLFALACRYQHRFYVFVISVQSTSPALVAN